MKEYFYVQFIKARMCICLLRFHICLLRFHICLLRFRITSMLVLYSESVRIEYVGTSNSHLVYQYTRMGTKLRSIRTKSIITYVYQFSYGS